MRRLQRLRSIRKEGSHNALSHRRAGSLKVRMEAWREGHGAVALEHEGGRHVALDKMCLLMEVRVDGVMRSWPRFHSEFIAHW